MGLVDFDDAFDRRSPPIAAHFVAFGQGPGRLQAVRPLRVADDG